MALPYRAAQLEARARAGRLTAQAAANIRFALEQHAKRLAEQLGKLPPGALQAKAIARAQKIIFDARDDLGALLNKVVSEKRDASFFEVQEIYGKALDAVAASKDIPDALLGAVRVPPLSMLGAYETMGGAVHWKTRLHGYAHASADEINGIMRAGLAAGVTPQELARRLRPYVAGSKEFFEAFPTTDEAFAALHDFRKVRPELRDAARKVKYQTERIAFSEIHNARAEAELTHFAADPLVEAVKWTLSPFRGAQDGPDECDALALTDFYGMGPGVFPIPSVPTPPHPFDRCERVPVLRDAKDAHKPKPTPPRITAFANAVIPGNGTLTDKARERILKATANAIGGTEQLGVTSALSDIMKGALQRATKPLRPRVKLPPVTLGKIVFPKGLTPAQLAQAKKLSKFAASPGHKKALEQMKALGGDVAKLEEHLATLAAKKAAEKLATKAAKQQAAEHLAHLKDILETNASSQGVTISKAALKKLATADDVGAIADLIGLAGEGNLGALETLQATNGYKVSAQFAKKALAVHQAKLDAEAAALAAKEAKKAAAAAKKAAKKVATSPSSAPPAPPPPVAPPPGQKSAAEILHKKIGDAKGSNPGGLYQGTDGVTRYVKFYDDAFQVANEAASNAVYRELGFSAPVSETFLHNGKLAHAARVLDNTGTLGNTTLTAARANEVLDGFIADVFTSNWDAVGQALDNIVVLTNGRLARIDQGGSLFFRAKAGRKNLTLLDQLSELDGFGPSGKNPSYARIFNQAGTSPGDEAFLKRQLKQIDDVLALETRYSGDWLGFVDRHLGPGVANDHKQQIARALETRAKLLKKHRAAIVESLKPPPPLKAIDGTKRQQRIADIRAKVRQLVPAADAKRLRGSLNSLSVNDPAVRKLHTERPNVLRARLRDAGIPEKEATAIAKRYEEMVSRWYGSSSSSGGAIMKSSVEDVLQGQKTVFHGGGTGHGYMDHDKLKHAKFRESVDALFKKEHAEYARASGGIKRGGAVDLATYQKAIHHAIEADYEFAQAVLYEIFGPPGTKVKLYRGCGREPWTMAGKKLPKLGEVTDVSINSLSSWTTSQGLGFSPPTLEIEVDVADIWTFFVANNSGTGYWAEREAIVIGRGVFKGKCIREAF